MKNEGYALIKHFDEPTLDFLRRHFDRESAQAFLSHFGRLTEEILQLHKEGVPPDSARGQAAAKAYWNLLMEFAEGDTQLLARLNELADTGAADSEWAQKQGTGRRLYHTGVGGLFLENRNPAFLWHPILPTPSSKNAGILLTAVF